MARVITSISIFLASPSDVDHERDVVSATIDEWNARHSRDHAIVFDLLRWENSISAGFGSDGQDVINTQINDAYDVLIALFWSKLGTPTPRALSGTVEEYMRAFQRFKSGDGVEIAFFFKDSPIDFRKVDLDQIQSLKLFESTVQNSGALTKNFKDDDALRLEISLLLDRLSRDYLTIDTNNNLLRRNYSNNEIAISVLTSDEDDVGLFDAVENLTFHAVSAGEFLESLTSHLQSTAATTNEVAAEYQEIKKIRPLGPEEARPGIERVSDGMNNFSDFLESETPTYGENISAMANDVRDMIRLSYDWIDTDENMLELLWIFRSQLSTVNSSMAHSHDSLGGMLEATSKLQRTTSNFNRAKRRFMQNADTLLLTMEKGRALIEQGIEELGKLILAVEQRQARSSDETSK